MEEEKKVEVQAMSPRQLLCLVEDLMRLNLHYGRAADYRLGMKPPYVNIDVRIDIDAGGTVRTGLLRKQGINLPQKVTPFESVFDQNGSEHSGQQSELPESSGK